MAGTVTVAGNRNHARRIVLAAMFGLLTVARGFPAAAPPAKVDLKPGEYDLTITYEIEGEQSARSKTVARCITPDELNSPEQIFTDSASARDKESASCTVKNLKGAGEKISYDADCSNRVTHVTGTVKRTEFLVVRNVRPKASPGVSLKLMLRGRRTGNCRVEGNNGKSHGRQQ
jgi:hypothetical protein